MSSMQPGKAGEKQEATLARTSAQELMSVEETFQAIIAQYDEHLDKLYRDLARVDRQLEQQEKQIRVLRYMLEESIQGLDREDEDVETARAIITLADMLLEAPTEVIRLERAKIYLEDRDKALRSIKKLLEGKDEQQLPGIQG